MRRHRAQTRRYRFKTRIQQCTAWIPASSCFNSCTYTQNIIILNIVNKLYLYWYRSWSIFFRFTFTLRSEIVRGWSKICISPAFFAQFPSSRGRGGGTLGRYSISKLISEILYKTWSRSLPSVKKNTLKMSKRRLDVDDVKKSKEMA